MPRRARWIAVAALCVPSFGFQRKSEVEQERHDVGQELFQDNDRTEDEGCSGEMLWVARQFEMAIGRKRPDLLPEIFTNTGVVISDKQVGSPSDVLGAFMSSLKSSTVEEEAVFCAKGNKKTPPKIAVRYRYTFTTAEVASTGTFLASLLVKNDEDADGKPQGMRIARAEIFSNHFADRSSEDMNRRAEEQTACSQEVVDLMVGYVSALGNREHHTLAKMFASNGYALSTSMGRSDPKEFFSEFLTSIKEAWAADTDIFCEMHSQSPMALVRFDFSYKEKGNDTHSHGGVYIDQFAFIREHADSPLKLKFVHMFENPMVELSPMRKGASYMYTKHGESCSYQALMLARKYLEALHACDPDAAAKIFAPEAVVITPFGKANAIKFYEIVLGNSSSGEVIEEAVFCQDPHAKAGPSISVRFHHNYTYDGKKHQSDFFGQLTFGRRDGHSPLQIWKLELFQNSLIEATPHRGHSSYLPLGDRNARRVKQDEREYVKFLLRPHEAEGCSSEAVALVDAYFHALNKKDAAALQGMVVPEAKVMTPFSGSRLAWEFYASVLPLFTTVSAVKEDQFCEMHEDFGTIATRSRIALERKTGVIFSHFHFVRESRHAPLKLSAIEIFDNKFILPAVQNSHHTQNHGLCEAETYTLVGQYLIALVTKNAKAMEELFVEDGKVKSKSMGVKNAKDFFSHFLSLVSDVKVGPPVIDCKAHSNEPPTLTVTFDFLYSLAGMPSGFKCMSTFHFVRAATYLNLRIEMVEMLQVPRGHVNHSQQHDTDAKNAHHDVEGDNKIKADKGVSTAATTTHSKQSIPSMPKKRQTHKECPNSGLLLAKSFQSHLRHLNTSGMEEIFAPGATVATNRGAQNAAEYFKILLAKLVKSEVKQEAVLCEYDSQGELPKMVVIFTHAHCFSKDTRDCDREVVLARFRFMENKDELTHAALAVSEVDVYYNDYPDPFESKYHGAGDWTGDKADSEVEYNDKSCTQEAMELATGFLHALMVNDKGMFLDLFAKGGTLLSPIGLMPLDHFFTFIRSLDNVHITQKSSFCETGAKQPTIIICFELTHDSKGGANSDVAGTKQQEHVLDRDEKDHISDDMCAHFTFTRSKTPSKLEKFKPLQLDFVTLFEGAELPSRKYRN